MTREEFQRLLWRKTFTQIADDYSLMRSEITELVTLYEIPRSNAPKAKKGARKQSIRSIPPLAEHSNPGALPPVWPIVEPLRHRAGAFRSSVSAKRPRDLHPVALATDAALRAASDEGNDLRRVEGPGLFPCEVSTPGREPAVLFIHTLLRTFERLAFPICAEDRLEVCCFGVWVEFKLLYRMDATAQRRANVVNLLAYFHSPALHERAAKTFHGRGDKPLEAHLNSILLHLLDTAGQIQRAEAGWSKKETGWYGTAEERFAKRRAAALERAAEQEKMAAEAAAQARELEERRIERERIRQQEEAEASGEAFTLEVLRNTDDLAEFGRLLGKRCTSRVVRDDSAKMTKQELFLWIVQTVLISCVRDEQEPDPRSYGFSVFSGDHLDRCRLAALASTRIPPEKDAGKAAREFLFYVMPETEQAREETQQYDVPGWLGVPTKAETELWDMKRRKALGMNPDDILPPIDLF